MKAFLIATIVFLIFLPGCKEESNCDGIPSEVTYEFRDYDTTALRYNGFDTIWLELSDSTKIIDTCKYIGTGKHYYTYLIPSTKGPGPCPQMEYGRAFYIEYISSDCPDPIKISLETKQSAANVFVRYRDFYYKLNSSGIQGFGGYSYASVEVAGKTYYSIAQGCETGYPYLGTEEGCDKYPLLINKAFGLLQLATPHSTLSLINIK